MSGGTPGFSLQFDSTPVEKWGINFAGTVHVKHSSGEERIIYVPGTRTYDPAGLTGELQITFFLTDYHLSCLSQCRLALWGVCAFNMAIGPSDGLIFVANYLRLYRTEASVFLQCHPTLKACCVQHTIHFLKVSCLPPWLPGTDTSTWV